MKKITATKKIDRDYITSPRDKMVLKASQDFLFRLVQHPTLVKNSLDVITTLIAAMALYPKQPNFPATDLAITVPTTFGKHKAYRSWLFNNTDGQFSISSAIQLPFAVDSKEILDFFTWDATPGEKTKFEDYRKWVFEKHGPAYEPDFGKFMTDTDFKRATIDLYLDEGSYILKKGK